MELCIPEWVKYAECGLRCIDPELFFPLQGEPVDQQVVDACSACQVREQCLQWAGECEADEDSRHGIWGGYTNRGRTDLEHGRNASPVFALSRLLVNQRKRREAA